MTLTDEGPVGSGQIYIVADVDGHQPGSLDDFARELTRLTLRNGDEYCHVVGAGSATTTGDVRFYQKDTGPDGRDVRVWLITDRGDGVFCAEALSIF